MATLNTIALPVDHWAKRVFSMVKRIFRGDPDVRKTRNIYCPVGTGAPLYQDDPYEVEYLKELEEEFEEFFGYLDTVDDLREHSLENLLDKAALEGQKFINWKNGGQPLEKTRFFHKINREFIPVQSFAGPSDSGFFSNVVRIEMQEGSQFEIWACNESSKPEFPVCRIPYSRIRDVKEFNLDQTLRDDIRVILNAVVIRNCVEFKVAFHCNSDVSNHKGFSMDETRKKEVGMASAINTIPDRTNFLYSFESNHSHLKSEIITGTLSAASLLRKHIKDGDSFANNLSLKIRPILDFRGRQADEWYIDDVRTNNLYLLADFFKPAILLI